MSSAVLVDISECPNNDILKCRFEFQPNYNPVIAFICSIVIIFTVPQMMKLLNRAIFDRKRKITAKIADQIKKPMFCRRCRKKVNQDPMDDTQKLSSIAPKNIYMFTQMGRPGHTPIWGDAATYTEEDMSENKKMLGYDSKSRLPSLIVEKEREKIIY